MHDHNEHKRAPQDFGKVFAIGIGLNLTLVLVEGFYGWRRGSILAAFINTVLLLVAMGSLGWEAIARLGALEATEGWTVIGVAAIGIGINSATALMFMRGRGSDLNIRGAFLHMAALLAKAEQELDEHFAIRHVTLQVESAAYAQ